MCLLHAGVYVQVHTNSDTFAALRTSNATHCKLTRRCCMHQGRQRTRKASLKFDKEVRQSVDVLSRRLPRTTADGVTRHRLSGSLLLLLLLLLLLMLHE
jgi:hypothetical protein